MARVSVGVSLKPHRDEVFAAEVRSGRRHSMSEGLPAALRLLDAATARDLKEPARARPLAAAE